PQPGENLRQRPLAPHELGALSRTRGPISIHAYRVGRLPDPCPLPIQRLVKSTEPRLHPCLALGVILPDRPDAAVADTLGHGRYHRPRGSDVAPVQSGVFLADLFLLPIYQAPRVQ